MPHGEHLLAQTAFRLPEGLLARLKRAAERDGETMTDIVRAALKTELDRREQS